jgi:POT family proton-dependent oligopeptide transporter
MGLLQTQPRAFRMIFMLEIWERFGFYTAQGILTLYFIRALNMSDVDAYYTFGTFSALVYGLVALGGFLGDRILGTKRTLILGLITLALGYLALACVDSKHVFFALAFVAVGNGLFKANPANLLSKCYSVNDERLHSGFTLYYMAVNLGAIVALIVGPFLAHRYGYAYAYFASFVGIVLGLINYFFNRKHIESIHTTADEQTIRLWHWLMIIAGLSALIGLATYLLQQPTLTRQVLCFVIVLCSIIYVFHMTQESPHNRKRMIVAFILMLEAILFFTLYQQMPTSLTLFAVHHIRSTWFDITLDPQSFQVLNPLWIIILSPCVATMYTRLNHRHKGLSVPYKFALGMALSGISFSILFFSRYASDANAMISPIWVVVSYCFQSLGEILISALGVAMIAELVSEHIRGFVMGMWFLKSSIAGFTGAYVASLTKLSSSATHVLTNHESLFLYTKIFGWIGVSSLITACVLACIAPILSRMASKHHILNDSQKQLLENADRS